jgi:hypothetical protein
MNIFKAWNAELLERLSRHQSLKAQDRQFLADMARLANRVPDPHAAMTHRQLNHLKDLLEAMPPEVMQQQATPPRRQGGQTPSEVSKRNFSLASDPLSAHAREALGALWPQSRHPGCRKWHGEIKGTPALLCATEGPESERFPFEIFAVGKDGELEFQSALTAAAGETGGAYRGVFSGLRLIFRRKPQPGGADIFEVFPAK